MASHHEQYDDGRAEARPSGGRKKFSTDDSRDRGVSRGDERVKDSDIRGADRENGRERDGSKGGHGAIR